MQVTNIVVIYYLLEYYCTCARCKIGFFVENTILLVFQGSMNIMTVDFIVHKTKGCDLKTNKTCD
jgi:hypothetical protein